jgi:hypothetical protein
MIYDENFFGLNVIINNDWIYDNSYKRFDSMDSNG